MRDKGRIFVKGAEKYPKPHPRYGAHRPFTNQMFHAAYTVLNEAGLIDEENQVLTIVPGLDDRGRSLPFLRYEYTLATGVTYNFQEDLDKRFFDVGMFVDRVKARKDFILGSRLEVEACERMGIHPDLYKAGETVLQFDFD